MKIVNLDNLVSDQGIRCRKFTTNIPNLFVYFFHAGYNLSGEILKKQNQQDSITFGEESIHVVFSKFDENRFFDFSQINYNGLGMQYILDLDNITLFN